MNNTQHTLFEPKKEYGLPVDCGSGEIKKWSEISEPIKEALLSDMQRVVPSEHRNKVEFRAVTRWCIEQSYDILTLYKRTSVAWYYHPKNVERRELKLRNLGCRILAYLNEKGEIVEV